jgi:hypothetical protein
MIDPESFALHGQRYRRAGRQFFDSARERTESILRDKDSLKCPSRNQGARSHMIAFPTDNSSELNENPLSMQISLSRHRLPSREGVFQTADCFLFLEMRRSMGPSHHLVKSSAAFSEEYRQGKHTTTLVYAQHFRTSRGLFSLDEKRKVEKDQN